MPVRGSTTGRPIMVLLDALGRRWMLRVVWELRDGPQTFRSLQARCGGLSPTVLNTRLAEARALGFVEQGEEGYALTQTGRELFVRIVELEKWADGWAAGRTRPEE